MRENVGMIIRLLRESKGSQRYLGSDTKTEEILETFGAEKDNHGWYLSRKTRIQLALYAVSQGAEIETVVQELTWKDFEGLVAQILEENGFYCIESLRRRGDCLEKGMEIDVVGVRYKKILVIDAKMWGIRAGKKSALITAAENHKTRTLQFSRVIHEFAKKLELKEKTYQLFPILVTWLVEDVTIHEGVPLVPIFKLNQFILDFDSYADHLFRKTVNL